MQFNTVVENDQKSREKFQMYAGKQEKKSRKSGLKRIMMKTRKKKWKSWKNQQKSKKSAINRKRNPKIQKNFLISRPGKI